MMTRTKKDGDDENGIRTVTVKLRKRLKKFERKIMRYLVGL